MNFTRLLPFLLKLHDNSTTAYLHNTYKEYPKNNARFEFAAMSQKKQTFNV